MRTKLTDILSTMDEYFHSENDDEIKLDIYSDIDEIPDNAVITSLEATLTEMLIIRKHKTKLNERTPYRMENVKPFGEFITEINQTTYTTTQSYFGCLEDPDDEEE